MTNIFKTYAPFLATGFVVALAALTVFGLAQPKEVAAQSCRTVDLGNFGVSSQSEDDRRGLNPGGSSDGLVESNPTLTMSDYINSDEYVSAVDISAGVSANSSTGGSAQGAVEVFVDGSSKINISVSETDDNSDSSTVSFTDSYSESSSISTITVDAAANSSARAPDGEYTRSTGSSNADISLTACETGSGNQAPVALDDGTPDRISVDKDNVTAINVLANDDDPDGDNDALQILTPSTSNANTGVSIIQDAGIDKISYDPSGYSGSYPLADEISYTIEDSGGLTDTATAFISVVPDTGTVTIEAGNGTSDELFANTEEDTITLSPEYTDSPDPGGNAVLASGEKQLGPLSLSDATRDGWTVPLSTNLRYFNIRPEPEMVTVPDGYRLTGQPGTQENIPIEKTSATPNGNVTGLNTSLAMDTEDTGGGQWVQVVSESAQAYCRPGDTDSASSPTGQLYDAGTNNYDIKVSWDNHASHEACTTSAAPASDGFIAQLQRFIAGGPAYAAVSDDGGCNNNGNSSSQLAFDAFGDSVSSDLDIGYPALGEYKTDNDTTIYNDPNGTITVSDANSTCNVGTASPVDYAANHSIKVYEYQP